MFHLLALKENLKLTDLHTMPPNIQIRFLRNIHIKKLVRDFSMSDFQTMLAQQTFYSDKLKMYIKKLVQNERTKASMHQKQNVNPDNLRQNAVL